jgi:hypothetical protein
MAQLDKSQPISIEWDGTPERAAQIDTWARDSALIARWQAPRGDDPARVLVERDFPHSNSWEPVPVGAWIVRASRDQAAWLSIRQAPAA